MIFRHIALFAAVATGVVLALVASGSLFDKPDEQSGQTAAADDATARPGGCDIKGNINRTGDRVYHLPGSQYYRSIEIEPARGERWFCTENEARDAGWDRSSR